jgi:hypothetical protein
MWKFLLDPTMQGLLFLLVLCALAYVVWDLYDETRDPYAGLSSPSRRRRREPSPEPVTPRERTRVEPSVLVWTDAQGDMQGRVTRGPCRGMRLDEMSRDECEAQATYCRDHDPASVHALETYIRARFARRQRPPPPPSSDGAMTREAALAELGLGEGATEGEIQKAYRKAIKRHHPDHGGTHAKAARINQAKAVLEG